MSHNRLRDLSALASLVHLQHLDASHNDIATDAGLGTLTSCSWLSLSHNASLADISQTGGLPELMRLNVSHCAISTLRRLSNVPRLIELDASHNQIARIRECEFISECQLLRTLVLKDNPLIQEAEPAMSRLYIIARLPQLVTLNDQVM